MYRSHQSHDRWIERMSLARYEAYRNSGIQWLGDVPKHWKSRKLKHIATFAGGGTPSRDNPEFWNGDIPWISPKDMKVEDVRNSEEHITAAGLRTSASSLLP